MRSANAMRSSFQSFCFGHSEESLKPTQSSACRQCLLPAASARGVVIESNNEGLAAVVCPEHEFSRNGCSGATDDR